MVLARCRSTTGTDVPAALGRYEKPRKDRTSRMQLGSRGNAWLKDRPEDADWVHGSDVWDVPVAAGSSSS